MSAISSSSSSTLIQTLNASRNTSASHRAHGRGTIGEAKDERRAEVAQAAVREQREQTVENGGGEVGTDRLAVAQLLAPRRELVSGSVNAKRVISAIDTLG